MFDRRGQSILFLYGKLASGRALERGHPLCRPLDAQLFSSKIWKTWKGWDTDIVDSAVCWTVHSSWQMRMEHQTIGYWSSEDPTCFVKDLTCFWTSQWSLGHKLKSWISRRTSFSVALISEISGDWLCVLFCLSIFRNRLGWINYNLHMITSQPPVLLLIPLFLQLPTFSTMSHYWSVSWQYMNGYLHEKLERLGPIGMNSSHRIAGDWDAAQVQRKRGAHHWGRLSLCRFKLPFVAVAIAASKS